MKILTITTLFPNSINPKHGIFVETRLRHLKQHYPDVAITVIAAVPWFPFTHAVFGDYGVWAQVPEREERSGLAVYHPRFFVLPKLGMNLTPYTMYRALRRQIDQLLAQGLEFDLIDGHYFFPDGVAIAKLARHYGKPFTMTARGTDINLIPDFVKPRQRIQQVIAESDYNLAVCDALRDEIVKLGGMPEKVATSRNGVDLELFHFSDEAQQLENRRALGLDSDGRYILAVGLLIERKGQYLIIEALAAMPDVQLLLAGTGPDKGKLERQTQALGVGDRVHFLGALSQAQLATYYGAVNASVLASSREGWANVLLESMACGTPVVATRIWGTPEVVQSPVAGLLVERTPLALAEGILGILSSPPARQATRRYAEGFSWDETSHQLYRLYQSLLGIPQSPFSSLNTASPDIEVTP